MRVELLEQINIDVALFGLGKNKGVTSGMKYSDFKKFEEPGWSAYKQMYAVANKLEFMPTEHRKFLRQINIAVEITAPRRFWSEFDTYKIGTTAQSESTMHTILKTALSIYNFSINYKWGKASVLKFISDIEEIKQSDLSEIKKIDAVKESIPESFLQCRVVTLNYEVFKNIYRQRKNHKLPEWREFCESLLSQLSYKHWITGVDNEQ